MSLLRFRHGLIERTIKVTERRRVLQVGKNRVLLYPFRALFLIVTMFLLALSFAWEAGIESVPLVFGLAGLVVYATIYPWIVNTLGIPSGWTVSFMDDL